MNKEKRIENNSVATTMCNDIKFNLIAIQERKIDTLKKVNKEFYAKGKRN